MMDQLHENTIALCQKAARTGDKQVMGLLIMSDGMYDVFVVAVKRTYPRKLKQPTLIPASDFKE